MKSHWLVPTVSDDLQAHLDRFVILSSNKLHVRLPHQTFEGFRKLAKLKSSTFNPTSLQLLTGWQLFTHWVVYNLAISQLTSFLLTFLFFGVPAGDLESSTTESKRNYKLKCWNFFNIQLLCEGHIIIIKALSFDNWQDCEIKLSLILFNCARIQLVKLPATVILILSGSFTFCQRTTTVP